MIRGVLCRFDCEISFGDRLEMELRVESGPISKLSRANRPEEPLWLKRQS